jgi:predicted RNase H-like nuclease (RuvC/YqgF family)
MSKEKKIEQKERELTDLKSKLEEKLETINESRNTSEMKDKIEDLPRISVLR